MSGKKTKILYFNVHLGDLGDAGFKYEWKVKGERILTHNLKNYFIFSQFSVKPGLWHENWHFLENHPYTILVIRKFLVIRVDWWIAYSHL